jgi:matrixin
MRRMVLIVASVLMVATSSMTLKGYTTSGGYAWPNGVMTWKLNPTNIYGLSTADLVATLTAASQAWQTQSSAALSVNYGGTTSASALALDGINAVFFRDEAGAGGETYWWASYSGALIEADIVFREIRHFYTTDGSCVDTDPAGKSGIYLRDIATHEFGHTLGLQHSSLTDATMYAYMAGTCDTTFRTLSPDDVAGIQSLYPPSSNTPPAPPSQLTVGINASNPTGALAQAWVDNATNADGYRVERSQDGFTFGQIAQLGSTAISYIDGGLAAGTTYYYRVAAFNGSGMSAYSNLGSGQTQLNTSAPSPPASPSPANGATGVGMSVTLRWNCSNAQTYDVYVNGVLYASNLTSPSVAVSTPASGTTYSWSVVATNTVGSTSGPTWSFTTRTPPGKGRKK